MDDITFKIHYPQRERKALSEFGQSIIQRISYFRKKANLSQKQLSIDIGMNIGYINRLESKKDFLPSLEVLEKIINVCNITPEYFFYFDYKSYEEDEKVINMLKKLDSNKREALLRLLS